MRRNPLLRHIESGLVVEIPALDKIENHSQLPSPWHVLTGSMAGSMVGLAVTLRKLENEMHDGLGSLMKAMWFSGRAVCALLCLVGIALIGMDADAQTMSAEPSSAEPVAQVKESPDPVSDDGED